MRVLSALITVGLLAGLGWQTHAQMPRWHSDRALWESAVRLAPQKPRPRVNLAAVNIRNNALAVVMNEQALDLAGQPWVPLSDRLLTQHVAAYNLAQIAIASGDGPRIIAAWARLEALWPDGVYQVRGQ